MVLQRDAAWELLKQHVKSENMHKHCLASEAVMREVARYLGRDEDLWGITGLVHDMDAEITGENPRQHGPTTIKILQENGMDEPEAFNAILRHNDMATDQQRQTEFDHALAASETITGMITATTLVYPDKKLASVKPKSVPKRMKQNGFAVSVRRENIMECEKIGIPLSQFVLLSLDGMKKISDDLGL